MARNLIGNVYPTDEYLLSRCAPAGYGLGEELPIVDKAGLDNWISSGWCIYYDAFNKDSTLGGSAFVNCKGNNSSITGAVIQEAHQQDGYGVNTLTRAYIGGEWTPWEYINPPMLLGVEYRTTERYMGKPVYTKLVDCGSLMNAESKVVAHGCAAIAMIRCCGTTNLGTTIPYRWNDNYLSVSADRTNIHICTNTDFSSQTCSVQLWYTKD